MLTVFQVFRAFISNFLQNPKFASRIFCFDQFRSFSHQVKNIQSLPFFAHKLEEKYVFVTVDFSPKIMKNRNEENFKRSLYPCENSAPKNFLKVSSFNNKSILMRLPLDRTFIALRRLRSLENVPKSFHLFAKQTGEGVEEYFRHNHQFLLHSGLQLSLLQPR